MSAMSGYVCVCVCLRHDHWIMMMIVVFVCLMDECYAWVDDNISKNIKWKVGLTVPAFENGDKTFKWKRWVTWQRSFSLRFKLDVWTLHVWPIRPTRSTDVWVFENLKQNAVQSIVCVDKNHTFTLWIGQNVCDLVEVVLFKWFAQQIRNGLEYIESSVSQYFNYSVGN